MLCVLKSKLKGLYKFNHRLLFNSSSIFLTIVFISFFSFQGLTEDNKKEESPIQVGKSECELHLIRDNNQNSDSSEGDKTPERPPLVFIDPITFEYKGLTNEGLQALKKGRDILRRRDRLFSSQFLNLDSAHHVGLLARLAKGHFFIHGPTGSTKSAFVNWFLRGEADPAFRIQLHQAITEQAFIGGQDFEAAKKGKYIINTEGSLADFKVGQIDEIDKAHPSIFPALFSLMNEGKIFTGNKTFDGQLETLFATSNANIAEMYKLFRENGLGSTAPAHFSRYQFKAIMYNWLSLKNQAILDQREQRKRYLLSLSRTYPEVFRDEVFLEPESLDWTELRELANILFEPNSHFMTTFRLFVEEMRQETHKHYNNLETNSGSGNQDQYVDISSADYNERFRKGIPEIVKKSVFLDFLLSPLADDENLESITSNKIKIDPLSLWRTVFVLSTTGPGNTRLTINQEANNELDIDFNWSIDPETAKDQTEKQLIKNLIAEQNRFKRIFLKHMASLKGSILLRARNPAQKNTNNPDRSSFELMLLKSKE
ncbi:MAG: AAA family ATPase [Bdellovibrionaceae bacterium]|nr:AAA family ATPase [Pseudobdellovibrionaceae bacterium]